MLAEDVEVLILTGIYDFSSDRICHHLRQKGVTFLRLNRDALDGVTLSINPLAATMTCRFEDKIWNVDSNLKSVLWRQSTFRRNISFKGLSPSEQLQESQWSAMMRGMMLFDDATWMNDPSAIYKSESKPYQLRKAAKLGFNVPNTLMTNDVLADVPGHVGEKIALKSVDTVLLRDEQQHFGYTVLTNWDACADEHFHLVPATCQAVLSPKLDLRVTVVENKIWCHKITRDNDGIEGDWRLNSKKQLKYSLYELPALEKKLCIQLVKELGLRFGAIDLALSNGKYWFIEINPTGEWSWLDNEDTKISQSFAEALIC